MKLRAILLSMAMGAASASFGCTSQIQDVMKGPGPYYYLMVAGHKRGIYKCIIEGENLKCASKLKINMDKYGEKESYYKKGS